VLITAVSESLVDAALVIVGHGSTVNADSGAPVFQHAKELRRRKLFGEVREGFWKQEPHISKVLAEITTSRVFIAPLFISEGYFSDEVIPRELGFAPAAATDGSRVLRREKQTLYYARPVGTHNGISAVLLARAREVIEKHPFPRAPKPSETALVIAGHGTERNENSRQATDRQVELVREQHIYAEVHAVFLDEEPRIQNCYQLVQSRNMVLVPFFISEGMHTREDIPVLLGEPERVVRERFKGGQPTWRNPTEKHGKRVWYGDSIGTAPQIADVILQRVQEAAQSQD
jgi:sirohydrochlorin cobaltochelatase